MIISFQNSAATKVKRKLKSFFHQSQKIIINANNARESDKSSCQLVSQSVNIIKPLYHASANV